MSRPAPLARTTVGLVVERRKAKSPWVDFVWRPVAALPGAPETPPWTVLAHVPAKWSPVRRQEHAPNEEERACSDSIGTEYALEGDDEATQFYVGTAEIGLYRSDTPHYRDNLAAGSAGLWVVLRPTAGGPPFEVVTVTANPSEGEAFTESGSDLVEPVPMPESVRELIEAFIAEHHVDHAFSKREQQRADPDAMARRPPAAPDRPGKDGKP